MVITATEFRNNQAHYLSLVDKGEEIIVKRDNKAYTITPIGDDDILYLTPKMVEKLNKSLQQASEGKIVNIKDKKSLKLLLESL